MCKASIVVPLYNGEHTIDRCLDSLTNQSLKDIEIVVIDDGSTDQGAAVVQRRMEQDKRIRLISQMNSGSAAARNRGVQAARGKYIGFVDCDDFVEDRMYEVMTEALERTKASIAICQEKNVYIEEESIQLINETSFHLSQEVYSSTEVLKWLLNYTYMSLNSLCYKVIRRDLFENFSIKMPEQYKQAEDLVASVGLLACADRVVIIPESLYYYVHTKGSLSNTYSVRNAEDIYLGLKDVYHYLQKYQNNLKLDNFSLGMYFSSMKQIYWSVDKRENKSEAARIETCWKEMRTKHKWHPGFHNIQTPFSHKLKIYVAYFHMVRPMCTVIKSLSWIPFFKYMA
ncbi:MAG: glycosyltransferase [Lachnospiraceae bacterium]|jgi:glycosyltransferase involved in cell wall biosynthesis|nr:glycosyltransferase [Lachnospiraceae bacterium]